MADAPNVFIYEIDRTGSQTEPVGSTTGLVGLTQKGPAFRPTAITTLSQFRTYFGDSNDSTYLYFASKYFLENNKPMTVARVLGKTTSEQDFTAGFNDVKKIHAITLSGSTGASEVLATFWVKDDVTITSSNTTARTIYEDFELTISRDYSGSAGADSVSFLTEAAVNFDPSSSNYINKKVNTDILKFHEYGYVLVQTNNFAYHATAYGTSPVQYILQEPLSSSSALSYIDVENLVTGNSSPDFSENYTTPVTPWIVSQLYGAAPSAGEEPIYYDLFRFYAISDGQWANNGIKVYISNVRKSTSTDTDFGSFDIIVRDYTDTDAAPIILERFYGCSLDPKDKNYIAKKIGDKYTEYDFENEKLLSYGDNDNKSAYIYVQVSDDIANAPKDALPWGYLNVPSIGNNGLYPMPYITQKQQIKGLYSAKKAWGICFEIPNSDVSSGFIYKHDDSLDNQFQFIPSNLTDTLAANSKIIFSLNAIKQSDAGTDIKGSTRLRTNNLKKLVFDANLMQSGSTDWASIDALEGTTATYFSVPLYGGFDALNPFVPSTAYAFTQTTGGELYSYLGMFNDGTYLPEYTTYIPATVDADWVDNYTDIPSGSTEDTNLIVYTFDKAINLLTDPVLVDIQTLACPGVTNDFINSHGIEKCEDRGDCMFVVEICENGTTAEDAIANKEDIGYDSSYAATYFPWYKIYDDEENMYRWIPPSIAALKAYSLTDKISFPWYASAGLLRGSMPEAVDVAYKSSAPERQDFANAFINPIASFPGEGNVIWGQNTLYSKNGSYFQMLHVRRLVNYAKRAVKIAALGTLFEPNTQKVWDNFVKKVTPIFSYMQAFQGLAEFKVISDETVNTADLIKQRKMVAKIIIRPIPDVEVIEIPFIVTDSGVEFTN